MVTSPTSGQHERSAEGEQARWHERAAWCLFDFANSAFVTIMITAFYGRFFTDVIAVQTSAPATLWGAAMATAMVLVALSSPVLGAYADRTKRKRGLLRAYVLVNVLACAALSWVRPGQWGAVALAWVLIVIADVAFEGAYVFYNAFLPELASKGHLGRLSGYGWALGYVGGLGCLALVKGAGWVPEHYDASTSRAALSIPLAVALWFAVFSLPMLLWVRERGKGPGQEGVESAGRQVLKDIKESLALLRRGPDLRRFFIAYLLFTDALETVIIFTGKFTGDALHFSPQETIYLFIILNVVAAPGALLFGFLVDRLGGIRGVALSLVLWLFVVLGSIVVQTKAQFWPIAVLAAIGLGATQSASRTVVARLVPRAHVTRVFGLMTVVGRASAIVGPLVYGLVTDITGSARLALATIGVFLAFGFGILTQVSESRGVELVRQLEAEDQLSERSGP